MLIRRLLILMLLALPFPANAATGGVFISQFSQDDPRAAAGGTDPVYLLVVQNGNQIVATANAVYTPPGSGIFAKVWSYGVITLDASLTGMGPLNDSFDVCDVSMAVSYVNGQWVVQTLSSQNRVGVSNPLGIQCLDLYPLITREFSQVF